MSRSRRAPDDGKLEIAILEALIFAADTPLTLAEIREVLGGRDEDQVSGLLLELEDGLGRPDRGLRLEKVAGGYRFATRSEVGEWVRRLYRFRNRRRLSPAALETLAIVAYRQPVTAPEVQQLRGVDPQAALSGLLDRRLVKILGRKKVVGRPLVYGTTREFLMHFGLDSLEELPSLDAFEDLLGGDVRSRLEAAGPAADADEVEPLEDEEPAPDEVSVDSAESPAEAGTQRSD